MVFGQNDRDELIAKNMAGVYDGYYITKSNFSKSNKRLAINYIEGNKISIDSSDYGPLNFEIKSNGSDTIFINDKKRDLNFRYILKTGRVFINGDINGVSTSYSGKLTYRNAGDLKRKQEKYKQSRGNDKKKQDSYGTFYGTLEQVGVPDKMDTIQIFDYVYEHQKGGFLIREKMVKIVSMSDAFEPIYVPIAKDLDLNRMSDYSAEMVDLMIDFANKVMYFKDKSKNLKFEGIQLMEGTANK